MPGILYIMMPDPSFVVLLDTAGHTTEYDEKEGKRLACLLSIIYGE